MRTATAFAALLLAPLATAPALAADSTDSAARVATTRLALPAPDASDLVVASALVADAPEVDADRAPVAFSWALDGARVESAAAPHVAASREHWARVTAAELARGIDPAISSAGALVRVSPAGGRDVALSPDAIELVAGGAVHRGGEAAATLADAAALAEAGAEFPAGTLALRLRSELGAGPFRLRLRDADASGAAEFLVHVFEPASAVVLSFGADRTAYSAGGTGEVALHLADAGRALAIDSGAYGYVLSPSGRSQELRFERGTDGALRARFDLRGESGANGLWQAEVAVTSGLDEGTGLRGRVVRRNARTAFAVAAPTAAIRGELALASPRRAGDALRLSVPVSVGSPGRYTVRAVLGHRDGEGAAIGVARGEASAWLERGAGEVELVFDAASLAGAKRGEALELVELELADPGRMGLLERRALALSLGGR